MRKGQKGRPLTVTERENLSRILTGRRKSSEWKQLMVQKMTGKAISSDVREKIATSLTGRTLPEEHRRHISAGGRGKQIGHPNYTTHGGRRGLAGYRLDIGLFVRSRLEANFARFLIYEGIDFLYEPTRFLLPNEIHPTTSYCPDFYLPDLDVFVETKGWYEQEDVEKVELTRSRYHKRILVVLQDGSWWQQIVDKYSQTIPEWENDRSVLIQTKMEERSECLDTMKYTL